MVVHVAIWFLEVMLHLACTKPYVSSVIVSVIPKSMPVNSGGGWDPGLLLRGCHRAGRLYGLSVEGTIDECA